MTDLLLEKEPPPSGQDPTAEEHEDGARMAFLDHLDELRKRLVRSVIYLFVAFLACLFFYDKIYELIARPIHLATGSRLAVTGLTEAIGIYLKMSALVGVFLASPLILHQVWLFISPGLYRKEKKYVVPFLLSSTVLFIAGGAFGYFVALPKSLTFLVEFSKNFNQLFTAKDYFGFAALIILGMGGVFQIPVLVGFLSMFGLVTPRFMIRNLRYAVLVIAILAAVISPGTDLMSQFIFAAPMLILYIVSIGVAWVFKSRRARKAGVRE